MRYASNIMSVKGKALILDGCILAIPSIAPNYKFAVVSDLHVDSSIQGAPNDIQNMFQKLKLNKVSNIYCCGDLVTNSNVSNFSKFLEIRNENGNVNFCSCKGNHDYSIGSQLWTDGLGHDLNYQFSIGDYMFLFMSIDTSTNNINQPYNLGTLSWLQQQLYNSASKTVFLFMHYPINPNDQTEQFAGLRKGGSSYAYGYSYGSTYSAQLLSYLKNAASNHVIAFSGHSHYAFDVDETYPGILHYSWTNGSRNLDLMHVPSLSVPRDKDHQTIASGNPQNQPSQCYIVEVYDNKILVKGLELNLTNAIAGEEVNRFEIAL